MTENLVKEVFCLDVLFIIEMFIFSFLQLRKVCHASSTHNITLNGLGLSLATFCTISFLLKESLAAQDVIQKEGEKELDLEKKKKKNRI